MVYMYADGIQQCKLLFIFKSKNRAKNNRIKREMFQYYPSVTIQKNLKAYCNSVVIVKWLKI